MMPADDDDQQYYRRRHQEALTMAQSATEPAVRKIHDELAQRYAGLALGSNDHTNTVLDPSNVIILAQMAAATRSRS